MELAHEIEVACADVAQLRHHAAATEDLHFEILARAASAEHAVDELLHGRGALINLLGSGSSPSPGLLAEWRVGAILEAVAVRDARSGQLWLDIAGQRHPARLASGNADGPQNGERLQVRVLRNSPVLALETLSTPSGSSSADSAVFSDALRKFVPRQQNPALLLANLAWIAQRKSGVETLPRPIVQSAAHLWHAMPEATHSDAAGHAPVPTARGALTRLPAAPATLS